MSINVKVNPSVSDIHPRVIKLLERNKAWHERHGFEQDYTIEEILKGTAYIATPEFLVLITDDSADFHGNIGIAVFRKDGTLIDARIFHHEDEEHPFASKKSFSGVPIIGDSKPFRFVPRRKRDRDDPLL